LHILDGEHALFGQSFEVGGKVSETQPRPNVPVI